MLVTVVVQFTTKTTNSKTVVYCLSLMPYSINKLKSYMLFTSKNFVFSEFMYKKKSFAPENGGINFAPVYTALYKNLF